MSQIKKGNQPPWGQTPYPNRNATDPLQRHKVGGNYGERRQLQTSQASETPLQKIRDFFSPKISNNIRQFSSEFDSVSVNERSIAQETIRQKNYVEFKQGESSRNGITDATRLRFLDSILKIKV